MSDEPTMAEKLAAFHNHQLLAKPGTYYSVAQAGELEAGGRFAVSREKEVPLQAAGSPWAADMGTAPALGYSVEAQEACGTPAEIEASIRRLEASTPGASTGTAVVPPAPPVEHAAVPKFRRRF
jgi:hypothetical protein